MQTFTFYITEELNNTVAPQECTRNGKEKKAILGRIQNPSSKKSYLTSSSAMVFGLSYLEKEGGN